MNAQFDVLIVGGGPAGCACALAMHNKGYRVALIDKATFPRDKVCGDAIPGQSFKAIHQLNPQWSAALQQFAEQTPIHASKAFFGNKIFRYQWKLFASNSKRIDFDHFLYNLVRSETTTTLIQNQQVAAVSHTHNGLLCTLKDGSQLETAIVIGCDGSNSIVKRSLLKKTDNKEDVYAAVRIYYSGITGVTPGENEFHYLKEVEGYFWIFPLPNQWCNVGFGILKNKQKQGAPTDARKTLETIINSAPFKQRFQHAVPMSKLTGYSLPVWGKTQVLSGERCLLAGDAACLVDPLQGHGIDKAIRSGIMAANQAVKCLTAHSFDAAFMRQYDTAIHQSLGKELRRNYLIRLYWSRFPGVVQWLTNLNPPQKWIDLLLKKIKL